MSKQRRLVTAFLVVFALLVAACGGDDGATTDTTSVGDSPATTAGGDTPDTTAAAAGEDVTLRVVIHQNPAFTEYMEAFNADFEAANPGVTVDMSVVAPADMGTVIQTRLSANDIDVIDYCVAPCAGFSNAIQPYMSGVEKPAWQQLIEANLIMDLTDEPFIQNFDEATVADAVSFDGKVYGINMGRNALGGMFVNETLLADLGVDIPTTWDELVASCETITASGNACMTQGGGDTWPIFVGSYGLLGAEFPDQAELSEGLWTGDIKWNEGKALETIEKFQVYSTEMLEPGVTGLGHDEATARYATGGDVAFLPTGSWQGANLDGFEPDFEWTYIPFPGSDDAADNQYLFGKYDLSFLIAQDTPHPELAKAYLAGLSDPDNYQAFIDATGFIPTQPTATLGSTIGEAVQPLLSNYRNAFEQIWVAPTGAGQWANAWQAAAWFAPYNEWEDAKALADQAQADLEAGLGG